MKATRLLLTLLLIPFLTFAQPLNLDWVNANNEAGVSEAMALGSDGSTYYVGRFFQTKDFDPGPSTSNLTSNGTSDVFVLKLDNQGDFVWAKSFGGSGLDFASDIQIDNQDNLYILGQYKNTVDFDPGNSSFNLSSSGNDDVYLLKLNSTGDFQWAKSFGGTGYEKGISLKIASNNDIIIGGTFQNTADFDPGSSVNNMTVINSADCYVLRLNSQGDFIWAKQIGGPGSEEVGEIELDNTGNIIISGGFYQSCDFDPGAANFSLNSNGQIDAFVCKLASNGNFVWAKSFGGPYQDIIKQIELDINNNIYIAGYFHATVDFDPGNNSFTKTSNGNEDMFISKLTSNGDFVWANAMGGSYTYDRILSMKLDANANINFAGSFSQTVDFDPGSNTFNLVGSSSNSDAFLAQFTSNGNFNWAYSIVSTPPVGSSGNDQINAIQLDNLGNIYLAGLVSGPADFDPSPNQTTMAGNGHFYNKLSLMSVGIDEAEFKSSISLSPNPANTLVKISSPHSLEQARVFDLSGKLMFSTRKTAISVETLANGVYFVELHGENGLKSIERLVVNH